MTDFSQSGEQEWILEWADRRNGHGRFLDIGAADGVTASNTRALALRGWAGIVVEPGAIQFDKLASLYIDRGDVECVQAAVAVEASPLVRFWYSHDLVSTTNEENRDTWAELAAFAPCYVGAVTVDQLLDVFPGPWDMASVDVEGTSIELWEQLRARDAFARGALVVVEAENGSERWEIQTACLEGWARVGTTPNNVLLERL